MQKSRALSDAELVKKGAEYEVANNDAVELRATEEQKKEAFEEMTRVLSKEKDPKRFSAAYEQFIEEHYSGAYGSGFLKKGGHIDENGQLIAGKESKESVRDEMYQDFLKSREHSSKDYIEAAEHLRKKAKYEMEKVVLPDGSEANMATENQKYEARREMYRERVNTMSDSEYLLTLPMLMKPGVLESFTTITDKPGPGACCNIADGMQEDLAANVVASGQVSENENFVGQGCDNYNKHYRAVMIFLQGGKKIIIVDKIGWGITTEDGNIIKHPSWNYTKESRKEISDFIREKLKKEFVGIAEKQGFSNEQAQLMLQIVR